MTILKLILGFCSCPSCRCTKKSHLKEFVQEHKDWL